jgi:alanine racemase
MVRPGLMLYGLYPGRCKGDIELRPAMELKTRVACVKELSPGDCVSYGCTFVADKKAKTAVLPIGYGDGLHRALSGKIDVLVNGKRAHQIGRICMDFCMIDVTDIPCSVGDVVTVFGRDGNEFIPVEELAEKAGTISYEITCALTERVPRVHIGSPDRV